MVLQKQIYFAKKGLSIEDIFVYNFLKTVKTRISFENIANALPILRYNNRQIMNVIQKLKNKNMVATQRSRYGTSFIFPFLRHTKFGTLRQFFKCKKLPQKTIFKCRFLQVKPLYKYNNINIKTKLKNHNVVVYRDDVFFKEDHSKREYIKLIKSLFSTTFPKKSTFLKSPLPKNFNLKLLISKIKESPFLMEKEFASLEWCVKNYNAIIANYYKQYSKPTKTETVDPHKNFDQRTYSQEQINEFYSSLDDIDVD